MHNSKLVRYSSFFVIRKSNTKMYFHTSLVNNRSYKEMNVFSKSFVCRRCYAALTVTAHITKHEHEVFQ